MAIEMEGQSLEETRNVRTRERQKNSIEKLNQVTDMVDNINIDGIESDTQTIKNVVLNNLENQTNIDDIYETVTKIAQGISDIKRNQTNMNKKINEIQDKVGE